MLLTRRRAHMLRTWARAARLAAGIGLGAALAAGCGGDGATGPGSLNGSYRLTRIGDTAVPLRTTSDGSTIVISGGTLVLDDGEFTLGIDVRVDADDAGLADDGTYDRSGDRLEFTSAVFGDDFTGNLSDNGRTITVSYDISGEGDIVQLRYER